MDFQDYIETLKVITIPVMIDVDDPIDILSAHATCIERVDRVQAKHPTLDVWLVLNDFRDGNEYQILSKSMLAKYSVRHQVNTKLDMVAIRRAIEQSSPEAVQALIDAALAKLPKAASAEDVANLLKTDADFLAAVTPEVSATSAVQTVQPQQPTVSDALGLNATFTGIDLATEPDVPKQYTVSIADSISRILTTRLGERVMRPEFGSNLYLLRDRDFDSRWRVMATRYIYEAITRWEPRVRFKRLRFNVNATSGEHTFYLELEPA